MKVYCKPGVWFLEINTQFLNILPVLINEYKKDHVVPTITSAADGLHSRNSFHYIGLAWDIRIWGLKDPGKTADSIKSGLQQFDRRYELIYGSINHKDHIHIEYDTHKTIT